MSDNIMENGKPIRAVPQDYYRPSIDKLRFILMFLLCIKLLGFPTQFGEIVQNVCGFVPVAFYILSGYLVLRKAEDRPQRILRTIKRTAITFGILLAVYFLINIVYSKISGSDIFAALGSKRLWFNFLVLNVWQFDIGSAIWYVQSMLYAYIIILVLDKIRLLRFDWVICIVCLLFAVLTGEFAGILKFDVLGYSYVPGNFLTRALPYILLGKIIHRNNKFFYNKRRIWYRFGIVVGVILCVLEMFVLRAIERPGYYGHLLGMPLIAVSVCMLAVKNDHDFSRIEEKLIPKRRENAVIYYICQPVGITLTAILLHFFGPSDIGIVQGFVGLITFVICYFITLLIMTIKRKAGSGKNKKARGRA